METGAFVVMPNHVHGIIFVAERRGTGTVPDDKIPHNAKGGETPPLRTPTLGQIVAYFKYQSTKEMNKIENTGTVTKFWQCNYGACPEPVEGNTLSAAKRICRIKQITSKPIRFCGMRMTRTRSIKNRREPCQTIFAPFAESNTGKQNKPAVCRRRVYLCLKIN